MAKDYYNILGVSRTADAKEIKSAYRKLARKYHPDVNRNDKNAEAKFKEVSEAHDVLSDPEKRKMYDQFGENWQQVQAGGGGVDFSHMGDFGGGGGGGFSMEDIFKTFLGGSEEGPRRGGGRVRFTHMGGGGMSPEGQDVEKAIEIPLEEIDKGTRRILTFQTMDAHQTRSGVSTVPTTKKVEIDIPAGTPDGGKIHVRGKGAAGLGGRSGDLYVTVRWGASPQFRAKEAGVLEVDVAVPFHVAALGGEVKVPTLRKALTMTVPAGTQGGQKFKLPKQGISKMDGTRTDLYAVIKIAVPKHLNDEQKRLIQRLGEFDSGGSA